MTSYLSNYVFNSLTDLANTNFSGMFYPVNSYLFLTHLSHTHNAYIVSITQSIKPKSYVEAYKYEHWLSALNSGLDVVAKNGTWKFIDLSPCVKHVGRI